MRKLLVLLFIYLFITSSFSFAAVQIQYKPIEEEKVSYPKIDKIEKIIFGKTNENMDISHRLNIIEKKMFNKVYSKKDFSERIDDIVAKLPQNEFFDVDLYELAQLERKVLGKEYAKDDFKERLSRLEKKIFGAVQYGDFDQRYANLKTSSVYYNNSDIANDNFNNDSYSGLSTPVYKSPNFSYTQTPSNYSEPVYPKAKNTFWGTVKQAFSDWNSYPNGYVTGFTPSVGYFDFFDTPFNYYKPRVYNPPVLPSYNYTYPHNKFNHSGLSKPNYFNHSKLNRRYY